jgi:DNA polymerase elongation subunit (family B)
MVPKSYERIATAGYGQGLIEPLLVRAYVASGHSLPIGRSSGSFAGGRTALFTTGIVPNVVKADVASLYPSIMLSDRIAPATDQAGAFLDQLEELTRLRLHHKREARSAAAGERERAFHDALQSAIKVLINSFYGMLGADFALFCDTNAASRVTARGREILQLLLDELGRRGATLIEADTDGVLFSLASPDGRVPTQEEEAAFVEAVARAMPAGIQVEHDGRYRAMYSYHEKNYALLDYDVEGVAGFQRREPVRVVGVAFRSTKTERFVEQFLLQGVGCALRGDPGGLRALYRQTCRALRRREIPTPDVCVTMPLTKTAETYGQLQRKEEPYEVYLAAGNTTWKQGQRIHYYQARGTKKLLAEGACDYDPEFYVNRLRSTCMARFEKAFGRE